MSSAKLAPPGFTPQQWLDFDRDGYLMVTNALTPDEVAAYKGIIDRVAAVHPDYRPGKTFAPWNGVAHLDRETGLDHDPDSDPEVPLAIRKRRVAFEKWDK